MQRSRIARFAPPAVALKSRSLPGIMPAALLISVICFWIALSQVSVAGPGATL